MIGWVVEDDHVKLTDDSQVHIVSQLLESLRGLENVGHESGTRQVSQIIQLMIMSSLLQL